MKKHAHFLEALLIGWICIHTLSTSGVPLLPASVGMLAEPPSGPVLAPPSGPGFAPPLADPIAPRPGAGPDEDTRTVGDQVFLQRDGVWVDNRYDPASMRPLRIAFFSQTYFTLVDMRPEVSPVLALGPRVIFFLDGQAYEIVPNGAPTDEVTIPAAPRPTPQPTQPVTPTQLPIPPTGGTDPAAGSPLCLGILLPIGLLIALGKKREPDRFIPGSGRGRYAVDSLDDSD